MICSSKTASASSVRPVIGRTLAPTGGNNGGHVNLKVEDLKPEYAGKIHLHLSAVDDIRPHPNDAPSIGMIPCNRNNAVIVEYARSR